MTKTCPWCGASPTDVHAATCRRGLSLHEALGTASDADIGRRYNLPSRSVQKLRTRRDIPAFPGPQGERAATKWSAVDWTRTNRQLARDLDVSATAVRKNRKKWATVETLQPKGQRKPPVKAEVFATVDWSRSNVRIAREIGASERTVARFRQYAMNPEAPPPKLGRTSAPATVHPRLVEADLTRPIRDLMREYSVTKYAVEQARKARGVDLRANPRSRALVDIPVERLGKVSDHELAAEYGLTATAVAQRRKKYGVAPFKPMNAAGGFQKRRTGTRPVVALGAQAPIGGKKVKSDGIKLRDRLRGRQEDEPTGPVRVEVVTPSPVDVSGMSTRERAIVRAVRAGKPWGWIEATYGATREEVAELGVGA